MSARVQVSAGSYVVTVGPRERPRVLARFEFPEEPRAQAFAALCRHVDETLEVLCGVPVDWTEGALPFPQDARERKTPKSWGNG